MQITSENGFKNAFFYKKLWPKLVADQKYGHFLCILSHIWTKKSAGLNGGTTQPHSHFVISRP